MKKNYILCTLIIVCITLSLSFAQSMDYSGIDNNVKLTSEEKEAYSILNEYLESDIAAFKMNAIEVIANTRQHGLMPKVTKLLKDKAEPVRFAAALAVGDTKYMGATFTLKQCKQDPAESVRIAAAYSLIKLGVESDIESIINSLESSDQTVKANAALIIGKLGNPKLQKSLHKILQDGGAEDKVKLQAIESLARLKDPSAYQKAWGLLISKRADDRVMGIKVMENLGNSEAINSIKTMINDDVIEVQIAAAASLCKFHEPIGQEVILDYLKNFRSKLNNEALLIADIHAVMALGYSSMPELKGYLADFLKDTNPAVRLYAAQSTILRYSGHEH